MGWSKNASNYPPDIRELFIALMETNQETQHTFESKREAAHFERLIQGLRYAFSQKGAAYELQAPQYTAELSEDGLTVRLCAVANTRRGRMAAKVRAEQRAQFKAAGVTDPFEALAPK